MKNPPKRAKIRVVLNLEQWQVPALEEWLKQYKVKNGPAKLPPDAPLSSFDLPLRAKTALADQGIIRLHQLLERYPAEIIAMSGLGYKSLLTIEQFLAKRGLSLPKEIGMPSVSGLSSKNTHHRSVPSVGSTIAMAG